MTGGQEYMAVFKIVGALLVAVSGALLGIVCQNELYQRILLLQDFQRGLLFLHQEIVYLKLPLEEAALRAGRSLRNPLNSFFQEIGAALEKLTGTSFLAVWEEMGERYLTGTALKKEDLELIRQLGIQLEQLEPGGSSSFFTMFEQRFEMAWTEARDEYKEKAQLYKRLGMMGGIFLVILLL